MRPEAQAKAGFYPTPPRVSDQIAEWLSVTPVSGIHALDPCAGEGDALAQIAQRAARANPLERIITHGIELHEDRADAARQQLDHVWHADAADMEIAPDSFSLLFLNPPYDHDAETSRVERRFLQRHTPHLMTFGVLVLIVPAKQVYSLARYITEHYFDVQLRRFPDPERKEFDQVVLFGCKRERPKPARWDDYKHLTEAVQNGSAPILSADVQPYDLQPATSYPRMQRIPIDWDAVAKAVDEHDIIDDHRVAAAIAPRTEHRTRPLTSMRDGHVAQLAAAGLLDNMEIETDEGTKLVKGRTQKYKVTTEDSEEQTVVAERLRVQITTLDLNTGEIADLDADAYTELLAQARDSLIDQVARSYPPMYEDRGESLPPLKRTPIGRQPEAIRAAAWSVRNQRATTIIGEMGTGKTYISISAAQLAGMRTILVLCPPHLTEKWRREIKSTIHNATATIIKSISDVEAVAASDHPGPRYAILSSTRASLGYPRDAAQMRQHPRTQAARSAAKEAAPLKCPDCGEPVTNHLNELQTNPTYLKRARRRCKGWIVRGKDRRAGPGASQQQTECNAALWQPVPRLQPNRNPGPGSEVETGRGQKRKAKYPIADYIAKRHRRLFDLMILDEVHEYKAGGSARGIAAGKLADAIPRTLALTGTYAGGYASTLFFLLYRFSPHIREHYAHDDVERWIQHYGFTETITKTRTEEVEQYGRISYRTKETTRSRERPGIMPQALHHILDHCVFLKLSDIADDLPRYDEIPHQIKMTTEQARAYKKLETELRSAVLAALAAGSHKLLGAYLQALLSYPDASYRAEVVHDPEDGEIVASAPALSADVIYPKEQQLIALIKREQERRRRVLLFVTHTESRDITPRMSSVLAEHGIKAAVLKSHTVKPEQRETWIAAEVKAGADVLICHPRTVQTGLDLIDFPCVVWAEPDYSVYTIRQASRRSWRIGQRRPVEVHHMVYSDTMQADALRLVAGKLNASKAIDGDIDVSPLDAQADTGDSMIIELARSLANRARHDDPIIPYFEEPETEPDPIPDYIEPEITEVETEPDANACPKCASPATDPETGQCFTCNYDPCHPDRELSPQADESMIDYAVALLTGDEPPAEVLSQPIRLVPLEIPTTPETYEQPSLFDLSAAG